MIPQKVNGFEVIAAIEIHNSTAKAEVPNFEGEWYVVVDRQKGPMEAQYAERYAVWNYQEYRGEHAAFHGFYTSNREGAVENMIRRSGFALATLST